MIKFVPFIKNIEVIELDSFNYFFPVLLTITLFLITTFLYLLFSREKSFSYVGVFIIALFGVGVSITSALSLGYIVDQYNLVVSNRDILSIGVILLLSLSIPIVHHFKFKYKKVIHK